MVLHDNQKHLVNCLKDNDKTIPHSKRHHVPTSRMKNPRPLLVFVKNEPL